MRRLLGKVFLVVSVVFSVHLLPSNRRQAMLISMYLASQGLVAVFPVGDSA